MKKIICILLIMVLLAGIFIACGSKDTGTAPVENSQSESTEDTLAEEFTTAEAEEIKEVPQTSEIAPSSESSTEQPTEIYQHSEKIILNELPKMSEENQLVYDKYIGSSYYSILGVNFSKYDFSNFNHIYLLMRFSDFYEGEQLDANEGYPAVALESTIQRHFNISTEDIKKYGNYNSETDTYPPIEGVGGAPQYYIITDSEQNGNLLSVYYTHYWSMTEDEHQASDDGLAVIEIVETGEYKYISNTTTAQYPQ